MKKMFPKELLVDELDLPYNDSNVSKDTFNDINTLFVHIINTNRKEYKTRG